MALQDLLEAITAEANERIASSQADHQAAMKKLRDAADDFLMKKRQSILDRKQEKMRHIKDRAESHARMIRNRTLLAKKQECMEQLYRSVLENIRTLSPEATKALLTRCLSSIREEGTLYPATPHAALLKELLPKGCTLGEPIKASGGFRFASTKKEYDFTYEFIVDRLILPASEVRVAGGLFSSRA